MKNKDVVDKVKLGIFVMVGVVIFTVFVFYIGSNNYKFGSSGKKITAVFKNVTGLRHGSIIRYSGVIIGTVEEINIISDSAVEVRMNIEGKTSGFIKKDSKARISTEGLLGNRYVSISPGSEEAAPVQEGGRIAVIEPLDFDNMLSMLNETGISTKNITNNLDHITKKIDNGEGTLGALISEKDMLNKAEKMISTFQRTGDKTNLIAGKMTFLADSLLVVSSMALQVTQNLALFTTKLNNDSSSLGKAITDTVMAKRMDRALINVSTAAEEIKLTGESIRSNWFVRHFGKKPKDEKDNKKNKGNKKKKNNQNDTRIADF